MQHVPTIAIVGRPNVGKSAIFNRMAGRRIAIVHDEPGVTRDRISAPCKITDHACKLMDTGGIGARLGDGFAEQVAAEADIAMKTADLILFVLDSRDHLTPIDQSIADHLRKSEVPVMLLLNKADHENRTSTWGNSPDSDLTTTSSSPPLMAVASRNWPPNWTPFSSRQGPP